MDELQLLLVSYRALLPTLRKNAATCPRWQEVLTLVTDNVERVKEARRFRQYMRRYRVGNRSEHRFEGHRLHRICDQIALDTINNRHREALRALSTLTKRATKNPLLR